jgi:ferredoxin
MAMIAARKFAHLHPVHTTNFLPVVDEGACTGCGRCVGVCPIGAVALVSARTRKGARKRSPHRRGRLPGLRRVRPKLQGGRHDLEGRPSGDHARRLGPLVAHQGRGAGETVQTLIFDTQAC